MQEQQLQLEQMHEQQQQQEEQLKQCQGRHSQQQQRLEQHGRETHVVIDHAVSSLRADIEHGQLALSSLRADMEQEQLRLQQLYDTVVPGFRDVEANSCSLSTSITVCEGVVANLDRRLTDLKGVIDEQERNISRRFVSLEGTSMDKNRDLRDLEGKVCKIANTLHAPFCRSDGIITRNSVIAGGAGGVGDHSGDREAVRRQFRDVLGDSLYVKGSLRHGCRAPSADALLRHARCASWGDA